MDAETTGKKSKQLEFWNFVFHFLNALDPVLFGLFASPCGVHTAFSATQPSRCEYSSEFFFANKFSRLHFTRFNETLIILIWIFA